MRKLYGIQTFSASFAYDANHSLGVVYMHSSSGWSLCPLHMLFPLTRLAIAWFVAGLHNLALIPTRLLNGQSPPPRMRWIVGRIVVLVAN